MKLSGQHEGMLVVRDGGTVEVVDTIDLGFPAALTDDIADFIQHPRCGCSRAMESCSTRMA